MRISRLFFICMLMLTGQVYAQEQSAGLIEVTYDVVDIRLAGTDAWLPLNNRAQMPITSGDTIRTTDVSRAFVRFGSAITILLLPQTTLTVMGFEGAGGGTFGVVVEGIALFNLHDIADVTITTGQYRIDQADGIFGIWTQPSDQSVVMVVDGTIQLSHNATQYTVSAGEGLRFSDAEVDQQVLDSPLNQARLIGELDGCLGVVRTQADTAGVLVRTGAGTGYQRRGLIANNATAPLLAQTESGFWTRIQYANGFGWVLTAAIDSNCALPTTVNRPPEETLIRAINADERERTFLLPFYGNPLIDGWFYQIVTE